MVETKQQRYEKFKISKQEPLRLSIALEDFFAPDTGSACRDAYGQYLHRRLRPAMAALIGADDTERISRLAALGWLDRRLTDECIALAGHGQKTAALVWLLRFKQEHYGYQDRDFSL